MKMNHKPRFRVEVLTIVTVVDTETPGYGEKSVCFGDEPWCRDAWWDQREYTSSWAIDQWKIDKAQALAKTLNEMEVVNEP